MQDSVLNLARVKLRDQQRLAAGPLAEYSQYGEGIPFGDATPRAGNDSGGGQPGRILRCKGYEQDPNAYTYFITQAAVWGNVCDVIGKPEWKEAEGYATPPERLDKLNEIFDAIEAWTMTKTKAEAVEYIRNRSVSSWENLTDEELEEGVREVLDKPGDIIEINTEKEIIIACKESN